MVRRQTLPRRWLLVTAEGAGRVLADARQLPRGSGILLLSGISRSDERRLCQVAAARRLRIEKEEPGTAARVHNMPELRAALLRRAELILLSPLYPTGSHPDWKPIPRMRAAAIARLAGRRLIALGGMNERRYPTVERLGFSGWAGISAFRT